MHVTHHESGASIVHHGDYEGPVTVRDSHGREVEVPADLLREFVANQVRSARIGVLEQMTASQILELEGSP